jgi:glycosyltransferase involved in cell wall biosynthesis
MSAPDFISVIIPAFNSEEHISEAIASVLAQTLAPAQIIVIDDGSTDGTAACAAAYSRVELIRQENGGPGVARNAGLLRARGNWIAFLDSDDLWAPQKLEKQLAAAHAQNVRIVFTGMRVGRQQADRDYDMKPEILRGFHASTLLAHRSIFAEYGHFFESGKMGEFVEWMARVEEGSVPVCVLPEALVSRRIHTTNLGIRERHRRKEYVHLVRQIQLRRRARDGSDPRRP